MTRNGTTTRRGAAQTARVGLLPGLPRLKLARARDTTKAASAALPDPARLKIVRDEAWPRMQSESYGLLLASVAIAFAAHAFALWLLLPRAAPQFPSGSGGQYLEAIEVTLVRSSVIEARDRNPDEKPVGASGELASKNGDRAKTATAVPPEDVRKQAEAPLQKREARVAPSNDGATARALEENARASGPAAASPGAVQQYAAKVREALARNKPSGHGNRGTATIKFSVSSAGKTEAIGVEASSGIAALDKAAVDAVRDTSLPLPPAGMTAAQLTYVVPFHFK